MKLVTEDPIKGFVAILCEDCNVRNYITSNYCIHCQQPYPPDLIRRRDFINRMGLL